MSRRSVRDAWFGAVIRTRAVNDACRVLLILMHAQHMTERGYAKVKRETLAAQLDIAEQQVTRRIREAVAAGLLVRISGGVNGQTVQYAAQLPPTEGVAERHPQPRLDGIAEAVPGHVAERHPETASDGAPGCRRTTPIRARATYKHREQEPAPDDSCGPDPDHEPTSSSNGDRATSAPVLTAGPWVHTEQAQGDGRWTA